MTTDSLTSRVARIISGSGHALVNTLEDLAPEAVMEQAIREVDQAIEEVRAELGRTVAAKHLASKRLLEENARHEDLAESIGLAVKAGRDDLAQVAIERQLDIEAQVPVLETRIADASSKEKELEGFVSALLAKRREMEHELQHFREESRRGGHIEGRALVPKDSVEGKVERAENAFDRVLSRTVGLPKMRGAGGAKSAAQLHELETMARKHRVEERLDALKRELSGEG